MRATQEIKRESINTQHQSTQRSNGGLAPFDQMLTDSSLEIDFNVTKV